MSRDQIAERSHYTLYKNW